MDLKVKDVENIMEKYAPKRFMESYDNVGLMIGDREDNVTNILIALDCTLEVIKEAQEKNCNLILNHHPLLFKSPRSITKDTLIGKKIIELIQNNINVFASHTNLDSVHGGLNDLIMKKLEFQNYSTIELSNSRDVGDSISGIGRLVTLDNSISLKELCSLIKTRLCVPFLRYSGNDNCNISKIAVINGSGQDFFQKAKDMGADCIITGDTTYHYVKDCEEEGVSIIDVGHFETEWPVFKIFGEWFRDHLKGEGYTNKVFISEKCTGAYKYK